MPTPLPNGGEPSLGRLHASLSVAAPPGARPRCFCAPWLGRPRGFLRASRRRGAVVNDDCAKAQMMMICVLVAEHDRACISCATSSYVVLHHLRARQPHLSAEPTTITVLLLRLCRCGGYDQIVEIDWLRSSPLAAHDAHTSAGAAHTTWAGHLDPPWPSAGRGRRRQ